MTKYTATASAALKALEKTNLTRKKEEEAIHALIDDHQGLVKWTTDLAVRHGMSAKNPTLYNAQAFIESVCQNEKDTQRLVTEAGYTSVPDLLRRHKRQLTGANAALEAYRAELPEWLHDQQFVRYGKREKAANREGKLDRLLLRFYPLAEEFINTFDEDSIQDLRSRWVQCETLEDIEVLTRQVGSDLRVSDELLEEKEKALNTPVPIDGYLSDTVVGSKLFNMQIRRAVCEYAVDNDLTMPLKEYESFSDCKEQLLGKVMDMMFDGMPSGYLWNTMRVLRLEGEHSHSLAEGVTVEEFRAIIEAIKEAVKEPDSDWGVYDLAEKRYQRVAAGMSEVPEGAASSAPTQKETKEERTLQYLAR
jgi:hypothetical protein